MANKDTLNFIETLIGSVGDITSNIQKSSGHRNKVYVMRINDIIGTSGGNAPNYKRYTGDADIANVQVNLSNMKDEVMKSGDIVTQQYFKSIEEDIKQTRKDNNDFYDKKLEFSNEDPDNPGVEQQLLGRVHKYMTLQTDYAGAVSEEDKAIAVKDIKDLLFLYGKKKDSFTSYYGDRVTKDAELMGSIGTVETYTNFILQELLVPENGEPGLINEETYHTFREGLFEGNLAALEEHIKGETQGRAATIRTLIESMGQDYVELIGKQNQSNAKFGEGDVGFRNWVELDYRLEVDTQEQLEVAREAYIKAKTENNILNINPINTRLQSNNENYKKITGHDYLSSLAGTGASASNKMILPQSVSATISSLSKNNYFKRFNKSNLDGVYESIINEISFKKSRNEDWKSNKTIYNTLLSFEAIYDTINEEISDNQDARNAGYKNISDISAYQGIDIGKIKDLIKEIETP